MCFSATASFIAAGALTAIGGWSLLSCPARRLLPLAAIPLLFAAQQVSEGILWLVLADAPYGKSATPLSQVFLFFALFVWPAYMPVALLIAERSAPRRRALRWLAVTGAALGAYLMACSALRPSYACIAFGNLYYAVDIDLPFKRLSPFVYVAAAIGPLVVSSLRGTKLLAVVAVVSFGIAGALYRVGFASVWCFFAAALSGVVALVVRGGARGGRDVNDPRVSSEVSGGAPS